MQIGSIRAVNGHVTKLEKVIDLRIQKWAAYVDQGGAKGATAALSEAKAIKKLIEESRIPIGKKKEDAEE